MSLKKFVLLSTTSTILLIASTAYAGPPEGKGAGAPARQAQEPRQGYLQESHLIRRRPAGETEDGLPPREGQSHGLSRTDPHPVKEHVASEVLHRLHGEVAVALPGAAAGEDSIAGLQHLRDGLIVLKLED